MSFEVRLEQFNGPLHKLLELIEEKKLEVTQVSLAAVTADFIGYVEKLEKACPPDFEQTKSGLAGRSGKVGRGVDASILADFIVVAARLLLIKSKVLLPDLTLTQEEQIDIVDLENRLKVYQQFSARGGQGRNDCDDREEAGAGVTASQYIQQLWQKNEVGFYVASKTGTSLHKKDCIIVANIPKKNRITFDSEKVAVKQGYKLCRVCIPAKK